MPNIKEAIATQSSRYTSSSRLKPVGIVLHSVGCPQPSAEVFVRQWQSGNSPHFTHYVLDDQDIYKIMPHDRVLWHVGSPGNSKWLGIEMCEPDTIKYTSGASFVMSDATKAKAFVKDCYDNAVWLLAKICQEYNWVPQTAILTHNEVSTKKLSSTNHVDPEHLWKGTGMPYTLQTLRNDVAKAMGKPIVETPADPVEPYTRTLYKGTTGPDVQSLQKRLIALGYSCGPKGADGDFGSATHAAVIEFQLDHLDQYGKPLAVDGRFGPASRWALENAEVQKAEPDATPKSEMARNFDATLSGTYYVTADDSLRLRTGAGVSKAIIADMPFKTQVATYGYFNRDSDGGRWPYVVVNLNGKKLEGYCSEAYLSK